MHDRRDEKGRLVVVSGLDNPVSVNVTVADNHNFVDTEKNPHGTNRKARRKLAAEKRHMEKRIKKQVTTAVKRQLKKKPDVKGVP
jgi:hypothetical protein